MQKIILYTLVMVFGLVTKSVAQEKTFEKQVKEIALTIEMITKEEKNALKIEVEAIDLKIKEGKITSERGQELKVSIAQERANNIESKVAFQEAKLAQLVKDKVEGKIMNADSIKNGGTTIILGSNSKDSIGVNRTEINVGSMKVYKGEQDKIERISKRTTSQFVFAFGLNNLITKGASLEDSDYRVWGSHFYEWGVTYNSRLLQNHNLLHVKYGLTLMYNNLRPTDNRYFVKEGNQTNLVTASRHLDDSRFRNVFLTLPLHLEFDFSPKKTSKDGTKTYFTTHESVRIGIGGYSGIRVKSKQLLCYEENGEKVKNKQKSNFNVSDFTYGLSTYIGYRSASLYVKYDLNPMFKHNTIDQNNVSLGIRFDFN